MKIFPNKLFWKYIYYMCMYELEWQAKEEIRRRNEKKITKEDGKDISKMWRFNREIIAISCKYFAPNVWMHVQRDGHRKERERDGLRKMVREKRRGKQWIVCSWRKYVEF